MPALHHDPDVREALFSLEDELTIKQVRFMAARSRGWPVRYDTAAQDEGLRPIGCPEGAAFIAAACSPGFVCRHAWEDMADRERPPVSASARRRVGGPGRIDGLVLRVLREVLHHIMRHGPWDDGGAETGGGAIWHLMTSRPGEAIAQRLGA